MLSLYVHIPFCVRKCLYCGFYSTRYSPHDADNFIAALYKEASGYQSDFSNRVFKTVYFGGGTPTVLSREQSIGCINAVKDHFKFDGDVEFTVEANPNSVSMQNVSLWREVGVNRLSLGVQSFSDAVLQRLGRTHTAGQAVDAFRSARRAGFQNIGIDLIYGVPGQSGKQWEKTVSAAIGLAPEHISVYGLSLDEGSMFKRAADSGKLSMPDDEVTATMYEHSIAALNVSGYVQYELSNFSLPGFECRHNMNYWDRGEYLGLGPGATSFLAGRRFTIISDHREYARRLMEGLPVIEQSEIPTIEQSAHERLLLGLRTARGLDLGRFRREFGDSCYNRFQTTLGPLSDRGLLVVRDGYVRLTERGFLLCNEALAKLSV
jgi:oxygen-independent coproporphyrinogen-3 oxidase